MYIQKVLSYVIYIIIYIYIYANCDLSKKGLLIVKMITIKLILIIYAVIIKYILLCLI